MDGELKIAMTLYRRTADETETQAARLIESLLPCRDAIRQMAEGEWQQLRQRYSPDSINLLVQAMAELALADFEAQTLDLMADGRVSEMSYDQCVIGTEINGRLASKGTK